MSIILETERIVMREMTEADAEHLLDLNHDPAVTRYIPGEPPLTDVAGALAVIRSRILPQYSRRLGRWACILRDGGDFLGWCGVKHVPEQSEYDIGYRFSKPHWGKGYASETATATLAYAREHLANERVVGRAMPENVASVRVLEKIGLVYEGDEMVEGALFRVYVMRPL
jgi:[ribosomal protein S5]-alanine N-acetyltransferase